MEKKTLHLTLKKKWFDMISSGEKKEEYREIKDFWAVRLMKMDGDFIIDRSGNKYTSLSPAWWFSVGSKGSRLGAANYLLQMCASFKEYDTVTFKNGYAKDAPEITLEFEGIEIGAAKPEWSDNWQGEVFIIKLGDRLT